MVAHGESPVEEYLHFVLTILSRVNGLSTHYMVRVQWFPSLSSFFLTICQQVRRMLASLCLDYTYIMLLFLHCVYGILFGPLYTPKNEPYQMAIPVVPNCLELTE